MRILSYISSVSWGGLEMNAVRYMAWFQEAGMEVSFCCVEGTPVHKQALQLGLPIVPVERNRKYADFKCARRLADTVNTFKPDVVWFRDNRDMDLLAWTKVFARHPFQLTYHQAMQLGVSKKDPLHTWRFRKIDRWIALLDFLADQVRTHTRFPAERIRRIPLGQDPQRFNRPPDATMHARQAMGLPENTFVAAMVGRIDRLKGQHLAIEALHSLHQRGISIDLLVVGEATIGEGAEYEHMLHTMVERYHLGEHVHFKPYSSEVEQAYHACDVFIMASDGETFGNVTIEAMLSGCCILGTNSSGTPELLDHGNAGMLFTPGQADALAEGLLALYQEPETRMRLAQNALKRAHDRYTKAAVLDQLLALLRESN